MDSIDIVARVNDVALVHANKKLGAEELRQCVCTELLRQAAQRAGLLAAEDPAPADGAVSAAACAAIESLLERELHLPEPSDDACRRHCAANAARYALGERVWLRHVLFAVIPGVDVNALRSRAQACWLDLRCAGSSDGDKDRFGEVAATTSNCPSGDRGGDLGWLEVGDCAPEFAREILGRAEIGVLPRLVHSRFGLLVVEVRARQAGTAPPFEAVHAAVVQALRQQGFAAALRRYLQRLASQAQLQGVDLDGAAAPEATPMQ